MWNKIEVDSELFQKLNRELETLKSLDHDKFTRFVEFVNDREETRAKINTKYSINTFIQIDLERMHKFEQKLNS